MVLPDHTHLLFGILNVCDAAAMKIDTDEHALSMAEIQPEAVKLGHSELPRPIPWNQISMYIEGLLL